EVATFTDANPQAPLSDFPLANVSIQWGDGAKTNATSITQDTNKVFHVFGTHTYAEEGVPANPLRVTVTDVGGSVSNITSYNPTVAAAPPVASNSSASTAENTAAAITLVGSDPNSPPLPLTYIITIGPAHGTLGAVSGNTVTYNPNTNYFGSDSFQFKVNN